MAAGVQVSNIEEYRSAVLTAKLCADLLKRHDLPKMLEAIERGHAFGPILDPTLYRDKVKAMEEDAELLRAALKLRAYGTDGL